MQLINKNIASFCINISSSYFMLAAINTGVASMTNSITLGSTALNIICAILYFRVAIFFDTYE